MTEAQAADLSVAHIAAELRPMARDLSSLREDPENARRHDAANLAAIKGSLTRHGQRKPIVVKDGVVIAGNGTLAAAKALGWNKLACVEYDGPEAFARAYALEDNRTAELASWDEEDLAKSLRKLAAEGMPTADLGWDEEDLKRLLGDGQGGGLGSREAQEKREAAKKTLAERFLVPPFSVLDARQGYWQERKRAWISLGIQSEVGRGGNLLNRSPQEMAALVTGNYDEARALVQAARKITPGGVGGATPYTHRGTKTDPLSKAIAKVGAARAFNPTGGKNPTEAAKLIDRNGGTSIFDPVLCELAYRWFSPRGGAVLDPFAGGSVRGIVAAKLGRAYTGVELRGEQVEANRAQAEEIVPGPAPSASSSVRVKVSAASLRQMFHACTPEFIANVCHASCCESSVQPSGTMITIHPSEEERIRARGGVIEAGLLQPRPGEKRCPFKTEANLCGLHGSPDKPFGCIASPLTLNSGNTLVVRNRYRALKCFKAEGAVPVYQAHRGSLDLIFGKEEAARIVAHLEAGGGDLMVDIPAETHRMLKDNDEIKKAAKEAAVAPPPPAEAPVWAKGFPVEKLKAIAAVFKAFDKPYALGAFSVAKEAEIASWLEAKRLRVVAKDGAPIAAVVASEASSRSAVEDFSGREACAIEPGDLVVKRIACADGASFALKSLLSEVCGEKNVWVESWMESPAARSILASLGFVLQTVKIKASSEIVGVWFRGPAKRPALPFSKADEATLAPLSLPRFDAARLLRAIEREAPTFEDHYSSYNKRKSWSAVALRSYGGDPGFIMKPSEMAKKWKEENPEKLSWTLSDTPMMARLPEAKEIMDAIPGVKHRVRLMKLRGGDGELARHADITDEDAGTASGKLLRIHVPILTNERVIFEQWTLDGSKIAAHMEEGSAWYLDTRKPHTAANRGETDRIHLVMDVESCPALLALIGENAPAVERVETKPIEGAPEWLEPFMPEAAAEIVQDGPAVMPKWVEGDSQDIDKLAPGAYDFVFSCPPYADLERYSDDPRDLSNMGYEAFREAYREIIRKSVALLKEDRFAVFVVGEVRDRRGGGLYRGFVPDTIDAFRDAGAGFYNEGILVTAVGSLSIRVGRIFGSYRKLGKTHQNVLVFCKGDPRKAAQACGTVEADLSGLEPSAEADDVRDEAEEATPA